MDPDRLVECVPNVSEGRRPEVVDEVAAAFAGPEVLLLDRSSDPDHNRSVLTLAGPGPALVEAAVAGAKACARLIDLSRHQGVHPRIGALDVLPFVPLGAATALRGAADPDLDCAALALRAGQRIAEEAGIPVYLYGAAARLPERAALPAVRRAATAAAGLSGGPAGEAQAAHPPASGAGDRPATANRRAAAPDLGGPGLHPTAGATAVGARGLLVAYNVDLAGADLALARRIAAAVRERDGGLPAVRAMGVALQGSGLVQVSMNLLDFHVTPPAAAFAAVAGLAEEAGAEVVRSEVVGLVPAAALAGTDPAALRLDGFTPQLLLEERLAKALRGRQGDQAKVAR
jgi:glutamate formiminotransferase